MLPSLAAVFALAAATPAVAQITVSLPNAEAGPGEMSAAEAGFAEAEVRSLSRQTDLQLRAMVLRAARDPAITGRNTAPGQAFALEVGRDGETVGKARLGWTLDDYNSTVDVVLSGPINQSSGTPVTDKGLASGASATLGYNLTLWAAGGPRVDRSTSTVELMSAGPSSGAPGLSDLDRIVATGLALERRAEATPAAGTLRYGDRTTNALNTPGVREAFRSRDPRRIAYALQEAGIARYASSLSLRGSYGVGSDTFEYSEIDDEITDHSEARRSRSQSVGLAFLRVLRDDDAEAPLLLVSAGYAKSRSWAPGRTRQICTPLGVASASECRTLVVGAPTPRDEEGVEIDLRHWSYAAKLGVNPHFSYDRASRKWTSEVGLSYLVLTKDDATTRVPQLDSKALTVGVRVGVRPEAQGGAYAAIFFGTVLSQ